MNIDFLGKCLFLNKNGKSVLVIGDLHLGIEEELNRTGVFVSNKLFEEIIAYLNKVFERTGHIDKIILLGDVRHEFAKILRGEREQTSKLFNFLFKKCSEIIITKGNHDTMIHFFKNNENIKVVKFYIWESFFFTHGDKKFEEMKNEKIKYWVLGHGHPAIKLTDGVKTEKYKCYLIGKYGSKKIIIIPSFYEGNAGSDPRENNLGLAWNFELNKFRVNAVTDNLSVLEFGILKKI